MQLVCVLQVGGRKDKGIEDLKPQTMQPRNKGLHREQVLTISNAPYVSTAYSKNMLEFVIRTAMSVFGTVGARPAKCPLLPTHALLFQTEALHALLFQCSSFSGLLPRLI